MDGETHVDFAQPAIFTDHHVSQTVESPQDALDVIDESLHIIASGDKAAVEEALTQNPSEDAGDVDFILGVVLPKETIEKHWGVLLGDNGSAIKKALKPGENTDDHMGS